MYEQFKCNAFTFFFDQFNAYLKHPTDLKLMNNSVNQKYISDKTPYFTEDKKNYIF